MTNVTRRADLAEAGQELEGEATILADSFNSWKRQIWISLIGITKDQRLGALLAASRGRPTQEALMGALKGFVFISKVDLLAVGDSRAHLLDLIPVTYNTFELARPEGAVQHKGTSPTWSCGSSTACCALSASPGCRLPEERRKTSSSSSGWTPSSAASSP